MTGEALRPLAIVGLSLKFPEDATSPQSFWHMIQEGRCATSEFPPKRINIESHFNPDASRLDSLSLRGGHFIKEDLDVFDAPFFSISASEAEAMDPQQRLILETSYRALENAGISMKDIARTKTCVFTGSSGHDYLMMQMKDTQFLHKWNITGTTSNMLPNRVSWFFDLIGPSAAVDTACSSSLMAIDMACQSIWSGDSTMGLAIGCNILLALETTLMMDNLGLLSKDSRCYSFDERANGYSRGEGVGALVIKPLDEAVRDGDTVRAVIRSSASNQDGRTPGITQPSSEMQAKLIHDTYSKAALDLDTTRYFEAHGTGTPVGDPIEISAIGSVFRTHRSPQEPLYIGSVKSNIGHLEGGSGVAGVIKTVLALERGIIPPNSANFNTLNSRIDNEFLNIDFPQKALPWPSDGLRRASVSSFGYGGSNTHIVFDDAYHFMKLNGLNGNHNTSAKLKGSRPADTNKALTDSWVESFGEVSKRKPTEDTQKLFVWSTADEKGISRVQKNWSTWASKLSSCGSIFFDDLAYTLSCRRTHLAWRAFAVAHPSEGLEALIGRISSTSQSRDSPNLAIIFSGQGAQWYAMGRELLDIYPVFRQSLQDAGKYLNILGCEWDPIEEFTRSETTTNVNRTEYSQILCTILQIALVDLLRSVNIIPRVVLGHSSGEVAAAYCSRGISRQSAWKISYHRGNMSKELEVSSKMKGTMLAIALSETEVLPYIEEVKKELGDANVGVGCINSPKSVTVSGEVSKLEALKQKLDKSNVFCRMLKVNLAYHSSQMRQIADAYEEALGELSSDYEHQKDWPEMISSVTGDWVDPGQTARASHWVMNMISPVRFSDALSILCSGSSSNSHKRLDGSHRRTRSIDHICEVGPHSVLQGACKDVLKIIKKDASIEYFSLLIRNVSAETTILAAFGKFYIAGYPINLGLVNGYDPSTSRLRKSLPDLPEYPFNHDTAYWHESRISKNHRLSSSPRNDLLGFYDSSSNPSENRWRSFLRVSEVPWAKDHQISGAILYPGAGMLVMAIEAAKEVSDPGRQISGFNIQEAKFHSAIVIPPTGHGIETSFHLRPVKSKESKSSAWYEFRLCSYDNTSWTDNCTGQIRISYTSEQGISDMDRRHEDELQVERRATYTEVAGFCKIPVNREKIYSHLKNSGYDYREAFQLIHTLSLSSDQSCVTAEVENFISPAREVIHPTTLDAIMQTSIWATMTSPTMKIPTAIPTSVQDVWVSNSSLHRQSASFLKTYASRSADSTFLGASYNIVAFDDTTDSPAVIIQGLGTSVVSSTADTSDISEPSDDLCHHIEWKPAVRLLTPEDSLALCDKECPDLTSNDDFFADVDSVMSSYITQALELSSEQAIEIKASHHSKYVDLLAMQKEKSSRARQSCMDEPQKIQRSEGGCIEEMENRLMTRNKRGEFFVTLAQNLVNILTGRVDPIALFSKNDLLKHCNFEQLLESHALKRFSGYLEALSHENPRMKILEIGAGTGAMTNVILRTVGHTEQRHFPKYGHWDFTDISSDSFSTAKVDFKRESGHMRFEVLNIEDDPAKQGFECGTYDIVVASRVLHATTDLKNALSNSRKLLKPEGKLLLYEVTNPIGRSACVYGLFEDFWRSSESYRSQSPYMEITQWNQILLEAGYSGIDFHLRDFDSSISHECDLIISTANHDTVTADAVAEIQIILDVSDQDQQDLSQALQTANIPCSRVRLCSLEDTLRLDSTETSLRIFLLELGASVLPTIRPEQFSQLQVLLSSTIPTLWVNSGGGVNVSRPHYRLIDGLSRVLMSENASRQFHLLSLDPQSCESSQRCTHITKTVSVLLAPTATYRDTEYFESNGSLQIPRLVSSEALNESLSLAASPYRSEMKKFDCGVPLQLNAASPGLLTGFEFVDNGELHTGLQPNEIEIDVKCAGLNFRDVLIAVGQLKAAHTGSECSGVVTKVGESCVKFRVGDPVAALHDGSFATTIRVQETGPVVKIPDSISFSDAATIPVTFATAYVALHNVARIQPGETVLIHSATGGTGQAAIQLAQNAGAVVFATVGSEKKKALLMDVYGIPETHIFSSRSILFSKMVKLRTGGKGVDVLLNSLAGESLLASWDCIAPYGRFLEIGKRDILSNQRLPMLPFLNNISYSGVDLAVMSVERPEICTAALGSVFASMEQGKLHPPHPINLYGVGQIEKAFRLMQSGQHIGKVVIEMRGDDQVKTVLKTQTRAFIDPNSTYVISGGFGGLGENIAMWLASQGARFLLLLSRSGGGSHKGRALIKTLQANGVQVSAPECDISDACSVQNALAECSATMPPIRGCIQSAMVLRDTIFEGLTHQTWHESIQPKVQGSWNLHRYLPKGLDFFIMLSSVSGVLGLTGQANYAAGNTFQDALAQHRLSAGEKAVSLNLGVITFAGAVADNDWLQEELVDKSGLRPVNEDQFHALLSLICDPRIDESEKLPSQITVGVTPSAVMRNENWASRPLLRHLANGLGAHGSDDSHGALGVASLLQSGSSANADAVIMEAFAQKVSSALGIAHSDIDVNKPLHQYGVDSLVAVELRGWLAKELQAELGVFEILGGATLTSVAQAAARKSKLTA